MCLTFLMAYSNCSASVGKAVVGRFMYMKADSKSYIIGGQQLLYL